MPEHLADMWRFAPALAFLVLVLWAGHKGFWYWGRSVRAVIKQTESERDEWRELAMALLRDRGVELPAASSPRSMIDALKKNGGMGK